MAFEMKQQYIAKAISFAVINRKTYCFISGKDI